jgi:hypothetical protein
VQLNYASYLGLRALLLASNQTVPHDHTATLQTISLAIKARSQLFPQLWPTVCVGEPAGPTLKARLVPTNTDGFYVLRALPWVDPACTGAAPQVADLLTNSDEGLRVAAAEALGSMGPAAASVAPQVADLLKSSDDGIRKSAAYALRRMGPAAASVAPQVADLLKNSDDGNRRSAAEALG